MADQVTIEQLRTDYAAGELQGESLVNALMQLFGYDRETAEFIASGDCLPKQDGDLTIIS